MTPNKEKAIAALLTSKTKKEAAAAAGISQRTLQTYFEDEEFCKKYRKAFAGMVEDAARSAQQMIAPALSTLRDIMADETANGGTRIQAARSLLEYAVKLTEQSTSMERMESQREEETFNVF